MSIPDPQINPKTYEWSVRAFSLVRKWLKVNVKMHGPTERLTQGSVFLFNHFARMETFIPQYLIYQENRCYCRSVTSAEFFQRDDAFSRYLVGLGAVPNNHPRLLPLLAEEILRGHKIIMFPEGGMVKDRRVMDEQKQFLVYSRSAEERRKHHSGASVLAVFLDSFKRMARHWSDSRLAEFADILDMEDPATLKSALESPTLIVPANITFYPLRIGDNLLRQGADLVSRGLDKRTSEELLIEGNILLKHTDMDIRLETPIKPASFRSFWDDRLEDLVVPRRSTLEDWFALGASPGGFMQRLASRRVNARAEHVRDAGMTAIYGALTINLSHLASLIVHIVRDKGMDRIDRWFFSRWLYFSVKRLQKEHHVRLHRRLNDPGSYAGLIKGDCPWLEQFLRGVTRSGLLTVEGQYLKLQPKLSKTYDLDTVRMENPIAVYANEARPVAQIRRAVFAARRDTRAFTPQETARLAFDDLLREWQWDRACFRKTRFAAINRKQTATESGEPFLFLPKSPRSTGILLVHGFLASPSEVRSFGEKLAAAGFAVLGVRLKGHGTSPWDLRERSCEDWLESVERGIAILAAFTTKTVAVGFSAGGALALLFASRSPQGLAGVAAVATPTRFVDKSMRYVPLVHTTNEWLKWVPAFEGVKPFVNNVSEHPETNYAHMPMRGLYEVTRLTRQLMKSLPNVRVPVALIHANGDPVADPVSQGDISARLSNATVETMMIDADRHAILRENIGGTQTVLKRFIDSIDEQDRCSPDSLGEAPAE